MARTMLHDEAIQLEARQQRSSSALVTGSPSPSAPTQSTENNPTNTTGSQLTGTRTRAKLRVGADADAGTVVSPQTTLGPSRTNSFHSGPGGPHHLAPTQLKPLGGPL
ncbi:hypothetical protein HanPI659440_Chr11g0438401 [Helianthus annuus]|nr:hypothetical protein HanPI659440_Chr11g0438401 [Helianthus annuus]